MWQFNKTVYIPAMSLPTAGELQKFGDTILLKNPFLLKGINI
jgi:hypothetical protein